MGGLELREATSTSSAAFLGSCFSSQELCYRLLQSFSEGPDVFPSIPDQDVATSILLPLINSDSLPDLIHPACGQRVFQHEQLREKKNKTVHIWSLSDSLKEAAAIEGN